MPVFMVVISLDSETDAKAKNVYSISTHIKPHTALLIKTK